MKGQADDWISELPPLDGADDEPTAEDGSHEDLLPDTDDDASLDDTTAEDLEVDDGVDIADDEPDAVEEDERWEADVGEPELDLADDASDEGAEGDASGTGESDLDLDDDLPPSADDAGEEGTTDALEQSIDEELPMLDADDEGDFEDTLLLETGLMVAPPPEGPRFAREPWERLASADRALDLAVPDDDAVASMAMCAAPDLLVVVTVAGRVLVDGDTNGSQGGRLLPPALAISKAGPALIALARTDASPLLWAANRTGQLARSVDLGRTWSSPVDVAKPILAIALGADRSVVLLAAQGGEIELLTSIDGSLWDTKVARVDGRPLPLTAASAWLAVGASCWAIGDANGVWIARGGEDFRRFASSSTPTAGAFAGSGPDAPLLFAEASPDVEESTRLLRATRDAAVEILAEITPPEDDRADAPSVSAMAWDEVSQSLRMAFSTTLCSIAPLRPPSSRG
jgi:hypothetical protein